MDGNNMMKELYRYFGRRKEDNQEMYSIANVFYEMGKQSEVKNGNYETNQSLEKMGRS